MSARSISSERAVATAPDPSKGRSLHNARAASTSTHQIFPFFALPRELRDQIYDLLQTEVRTEGFFSCRFPLEINYPCDQFEQEFLSRQTSEKVVVLAQNAPCFFFWDVETMSSPPFPTVVGLDDHSTLQININISDDKDRSDAVQFGRLDARPG